MLDADPTTGDEIFDILVVIDNSIQNTLKTQFESRVFNPGAGSSVPAILQEPSDDVIYQAHTQSLLTAAIEEAIPDVTIRLSLVSISNGNGTSSLDIKMAIKYKSNIYNRVYSTALVGFRN